MMKVVGIGYHDPSAEDARRRIVAFFEALVTARQTGTCGHSGTSSRRGIGWCSPASTAVSGGQKPRRGCADIIQHGPEFFELIAALLEQAPSVQGALHWIAAKLR